MPFTLAVRGSAVAESLQQATIEHIAVIALQIRASYYTILAGWVIYCYDIVLTLDEEFTLLWSKGGKFVKTLYLINRYLPFCGLLLVLYGETTLPMKCKFAGCIGTFMLTLLCQTVEIIVAISIFAVRLYTIYQRDKLARRLLVTVVGASHVVLLTLAGLSCKTIYETMFYSRILRSCVGSPRALTGAIYITPIFAESFIVGMTLYHAVQFSRRHADLGATMAHRILNALYIDGCLYYVIVFSLRLATALVYYLGAPALVLLMPYLEYALTSTVTSRWFLSFRRILVDTMDAGLCTTYFNSDADPATGPSITFGQGGRSLDLRREQCQAGIRLSANASKKLDRTPTLDLELKELETRSSPRLSVHEWESRPSR
ncbi:hypothetical protein FRC17_007294 [Serendipita sp. 399]|nr:hypothetical protein FRC17_007294 [Serendipita sp. 399]